MFLLPMGVIYRSDWSFERQNGSISHFALFGREAHGCSRWRRRIPGYLSQRRNRPAADAGVRADVGRGEGAEKDSHGRDAQTA